MLTKLIRDKIPELLRAQGINPNVYAADDVEYGKRLLDKLIEEAQELKEDPCLEELADCLEVILAIQQHFSFSTVQVEKVRKKKAQSRGRFEKRLVSTWEEK